MSIVKTNNAGITAVLDQTKAEYFTSCRNVVYLSDMTNEGLLRDINNVPIHVDDLVWIMPEYDSNRRDTITLGRVIGNSACYVNVFLGKYTDTNRDIVIRKHPDRLLIVSLDEVRRIIERAKEQK